MALLTNNDPTLYDLAQMPENGEAKEIIELLAQSNPMLMDAPAYECNKGTYHQTTVRTGLPSPVWGRLYKGIPSDKSTKQMIKDTPGFLESASEVDTRLVDVFEKAEDKASIRMDEAEAHIESMGHEAATALFYHDSLVDSEKPTGLAPRFSSLSAENGGQIINAGGAGADNTSIWMVTWDKRACHLIYPKGFKAGIDRKDRGAVPKTDGNGDTFFNYREEFTWHLGLTVRDWRYVARVANIDVSDLTVDGSGSSANIFNSLTEMYYKHYGRRSNIGKTCIYVNTTIMKFLDYQARLIGTGNTNSSNLNLTYGQDSFNAKEVLMYRGIPIKESDAILSSEAVVS